MRGLGYLLVSVAFSFWPAYSNLPNSMTPICIQSPCRLRRCDPPLQQGQLATTCREVDDALLHLALVHNAINFPWFWDHRLQRLVQARPDDEWLEDFPYTQDGKYSGVAGMDVEFADGGACAFPRSARRERRVKASDAGPQFVRAD